MPLLVNGEPLSLPAPPTVAGLIAALQLEGQRVAVERNGTLVPRSVWGDTPLNDGDQIELVKAIGGG